MDLPLISSDIFEGNFPVNCYYDPAGYNGRPALVGTPGFDVWVDTGEGAEVRGAAEFEDYSFWVVGNKVLRIRSGITEVSGTLNTSTGLVSMAISPTYLLIVDGSSGYYIASDSLTTITEITDTDFPDTPLDCDFIASRFVVFDGTNFWWSELVNTATEWSGTFYISPDGIQESAIAGINDHDELFTFGAKKTVPYYVSDGVSPLTELPGGMMENGIKSTHAKCKIDNSVFWFADDLTVKRVQEYTPITISHPELNDIFAGYETTNDAGMFSMTFYGKPFICIFFPTEQKTWLYNILTKQWCQWAYSASMTRHRVNCYLYYDGKHLIGDLGNGKIYELKPDVYDDDGEVIRFERISPIVFDQQNGSRLKFKKIQLDFKGGVGLITGQGSDPKVMLSYSDNNGATWSNERFLDMGEIGAYKYRTIVRMLGISRKRNFKIAITDPVERVLFGAFLDAEVLR